MTERIFYLSEFVRFFRKKKLAIFYVGGISFVLVFWLALVFSKPYFLAESTFRQVQSEPNEVSSLQSILRSMGTSHEDPSAISIMQSKTMLGKVVEEMGLQVEEIGKSYGFALLCRELGISSKKIPFLFRSVAYDGEITQTFSIRPLSEETFEVLDQKKKKLLVGRLLEPVFFQNVSWTLEQMPRRKKCSTFHLFPKRTVLPKLQKSLKIKTSRQDKNLLLLRTKGKDRETAMGILNVLMQNYQQHLHQVHEELATEQIRYLEQRRDQLGRDFDETLDQHVAYLQSALGVEGFLGLTQEIEMLSEPKEKYSAQKHQIDLEIKRWKKPTGLEASAEYPWKEGLEKRDELDWQTIQITPMEISTEEFSGMNLETTQKLHGGYCEELDRLAFQKERLKDYQERIVEPEFELSALSQVLKDQVSQSIFQKGAEIALQLADQGNRSEKECKRLKAMLAAQKTFLQEHMEKNVELLEVQSSQVEKKMNCLQQRALELLQKEKTNVEQKLSEIGVKMAELPEKWRLESQLKLKKELTMQILEGLTQISESKVLGRHLFHIESKPLDAADAPLDIQSPSLFLFASMGGVLGIFFFAIGLLAYAFAKGFPLSEEYLLDRKFQVAKNKEEIFRRIALETHSGEVLALIGNEWGEELAQILRDIGLKVSIFTDFFQLDFDQKKKEGHCILLACPKEADSPEARRVLTLSDRFLLQIKGEKAEDLMAFEGKDGICVLTD